MSRPASVILTFITSIILPPARIFSRVMINRPRLTSPVIMALLKPCATKNGCVAVVARGRKHGERPPLLQAEHHRLGNNARSGVGASRAESKLATADDTATMGTRRCIYAPPELRQCNPPRQFLFKHCVVKLSLGM